MVEKKVEILPIRAEKSPDFSVVHIDGVFGGLSLDQGTAWIQFFQDVPSSEVITKNGDMQVTTIQRKILVDLRMSAFTFKEISLWMNNTVTQMESQKK